METTSEITSGKIRRWSGPKRGPLRRTISMTLPPRLLARVDAAARRLGRARGELVETVMAEWLKRQRTEEQ